MNALEIEQTQDLLYGPALRAQGIEHGFMGQSFSFRTGTRLAELERFCRRFDVSDVLFLKQVHGHEYHFIETADHCGPYRGSKKHDAEFFDEFPKGDAFVVELAPPDVSSERIALAIRTADCVPVIALHGRFAAVIHAGWRGIAAGIVEKTLVHLHRLDPRRDSGSLVLLGPAAGPERYEVGADVIDALGDSTVFRASSRGKYLLDMHRTIRNRLHQEGLSPAIGASPVCTIASQHFHSYRRDKDARGNNLAFVVAPVRRSS